MKTNDITVLIINYQTPDLLSVAVNSFVSFYPNAEIIIFDNGSKDGSIDLIKEISEKRPNIRPYFSGKNIFHGPAMDFALRRPVKTKYCFILDSDTQTVKGGFLEEMRDILEEREENYAIDRKGM
ncbi:MAG: glycosyltransferase [Chitinispirillales bacterium]|jgi:GT2 family glycosyltransferase|nr:glycosyltransferase [Chitinispirillales bacterium]